MLNVMSKNPLDPPRPTLAKHTFTRNAKTDNDYAFCIFFIWRYQDRVKNIRTKLN